MDIIKGGVVMKKQHCVMIEEDLAKRIKIRAVKDNINMSQLIELACEDYLNMSDSIDKLVETLEDEE